MERQVVRQALGEALSVGPVSDRELVRFGLTKEQVREAARQQGLAATRSISQMLGLSSPDASWRKRVDISQLPAPVAREAAARADEIVREMRREGLAFYDEGSGNWLGVPQASRNVA